jgi:ribulose-5-phosphate 4-epimerase/fuculose-1-phosphate aldolase
VSIQPYSADVVDAASFGETVRLYNDFGGVVLDDQEGRNICEALGPNGKGIILQNHGILSAAQSVDAAVVYFVRLEQLCESQLLSDALGAPRLMDSDEISKVFDLYGGEEEAYFQAQEMFEMIEYETGGDYKA